MARPAKSGTIDPHVLVAWVKEIDSLKRGKMRE